MPDSRDRIHRHLLESADLKRRAAEVCAEPAARAADLLVDVFRAGKKLLVCGNGGSAADAQHLAAELVCRFKRDVTRPPLAAIALTTDSSILTAYANDTGFAWVFARQVEALGRAGDALVAISTSGASPNVLRAVEAARAAGMRTIGFSGAGGELRTMVDVAVAVPSDDTALVQEVHLSLEHAVCELVEERMSLG